MQFFGVNKVYFLDQKSSYVENLKNKTLFIKKL